MLAGRPRVVPLLLGVASFVPGAYALLVRPTRGSDSARYCYAVWLRHLVMARAARLGGHPASVVELGPGDTPGVSFAALLSGAQRCYALDAVPRAAPDTSLRVFDELVDLFRQRAPIPDGREFPRVRPQLAAYGFPANLLDDAHLARALDPERVARLRREVATLPAAGDAMCYLHPRDAHRIPRASVDMVLSQGVLEYPDDVQRTWEQMFEWLRPGGIATHAVEYGAHQTAVAWDGHWAISDTAWALLRGRQPYFLNRAPHSHHVRALKAAGFELSREVLERRRPQTPRTALAPRFRSLSEADLSTKGAFLQAVKPLEVTARCMCS